ncbi:MAG: hypothetical protein AB8H03_06875 [Saprospiraceae bacterium]
MKATLLFLFFTIIFSCSNSSTADSKEKNHRVDGVVLPLPTEFKSVVGERILEGVPPLRNTITIKESDSRTYILNEKDGELIAIVQLEALKHRVEIEGENYHDLISNIEYINRSYSAKGMNTTIIEKDVESKIDPKYFKVKNLITTPDQDTFTMTQYYITNNFRSASVVVWNMEQNANDLEEYVRRMLLF